jgi:hypothetical protein
VNADPSGDCARAWFSLGGALTSTSIPTIHRIASPGADDVRGTAASGSSASNATVPPIDLTSPTVTRPPEALIRQRMAIREVGAGVVPVPVWITRFDGSAGHWVQFIGGLHSTRQHAAAQQVCAAAVALVAQGIERRTPKPGVAGSNPAGGTPNL